MTTPARSLPLFDPDPVEHALALVHAGMDPESIAEALIMRRAAGQFMRRAMVGESHPLEDLIRAHIAIGWCEAGLDYRDAAQALHMTDSARAFCKVRFPIGDCRWKVLTRLRRFVLELFMMGREFDLRR